MTRLSEVGVGGLGARGCCSAGVCAVRYSQAPSRSAHTALRMPVYGTRWGIPPITRDCTPTNCTPCLITHTHRLGPRATCHMPRCTPRHPCVFICQQHAWPPSLPPNAICASALRRTFFPSLPNRSPKAHFTPLLPAMRTHAFCRTQHPPHCTRFVHVASPIPRDGRTWQSGNGMDWVYFYGSYQHRRLADCICLPTA